MVNEGGIPGLGSNVKTIYVDTTDDSNTGNNINQAQLVIFVQAGIGGFIRDFVISDVNPFADIIV